AGDVAQANARRESLGRAAGWAVIILGAALGTVLCAGVGGLVVVSIYLFRKPRLPPRPAPEESPFVYDSLLWALVIFLLVMLNTPVLHSMLRDIGVDASDAMYLLAMLLPLMYLASLRGEAGVLGQIRWFEGAWWRQVGAGLVGYAAYVPFLGVLLALTLWVAPALPAEQTNPLGERAMRTQTTLEWLWLFVQAAVLAPIIEEFVFRGVLFKVMWQRTGRVWLSAFASGYLFAVIHPQFLGGVFPITVLGAILALVYAHTRSLLPCILIHALNNGLITLILWGTVG
ncbi:MAG: lysostaphin resistance A-like protein, partial [Fimbriimonadales bacterium]